MCGLAGFTGEEPVDLNALRILLLDNQVRGRDSVGVYGRQLYRAVGAPDTVIGHSDFANAVTGAHQVIAHNRFSTRGVVSKENAHPFKIGEGRKALYGTHNGFIFDQLYGKLCDDFKLNPRPAVDSLALYQILYNAGMDFDILSKIEAIAALAFIYDGKLHLYRRPSRPLFIGEFDRGIYYSSREDGLWMIGANYVQALEEHRMHVFENGKLIEAPLVKKSILHYIPDTSPSMWDNHVRPEDKQYFPEVWRPKDPKQTTHRTDTTTTRQLEIEVAGGSKGRENAGNQNSTDGGINNREKFEELYEYLEMDLLENAQEIELPDKVMNIRDYYEEGDLTAVHLILSLRDDVHEAPLPNWVVGIKGMPETFGITASRGFVIIRLDLNDVKDPATNAPKELQLIVADPFHYKDYYTKKMVFNSGRVVEGTLLVPFRTEEEKKKARSFRTVENNLLTRAVLARQVRRSSRRNSADSSEDKVHEKTKSLRNSERRQERSTIKLPEDSAKLIEEAVGRQLLLLADNRPEMVKGKTSLAPPRIEAIRKDLERLHNEILSAQSKETTPGDKALEQDKEPTYGPYNVTIRPTPTLKAVLCENCGKMMKYPVDALVEEEPLCIKCTEQREQDAQYATAIQEDWEQGGGSPEFWRKATQQLEKEKKMNLDNQKFLSPASDIPNRQTMDQARREKILSSDAIEFLSEGSTTSKKFVFLPFDKEEHLIRHQRDFSLAQRDKLKVIMDIVEAAMTSYYTEDEYKQILGDIYSKVIHLHTDVALDVDQYDEIIKSDDFQPF